MLNHVGCRIAEILSTSFIIDVSNRLATFLSPFLQHHDTWGKTTTWALLTCGGRRKKYSFFFSAQKKWFFFFMQQNAYGKLYRRKTIPTIYIHALCFIRDSWFFQLVLSLIFFRILTSAVPYLSLNFFRISYSPVPYKVLKS